MLPPHLIDEPAAHQTGFVEGNHDSEKVPFHCHNHRLIIPARSYAGGEAAEYTAICERSVQQV